jgi:hypothetical protein
MRVLYSPQVNEKDTLEYLFEGDKITATYNGEVDIFDFTGMPDGRANSHDRYNTTIISTLPFCPVIEAEKKDGILSVKLIKFIKEDASHEDRFPDWIEV